MPSTEKIVIVGFGWVGQANALSLIRMGYNVSYYDIVKPKFHYADKYLTLYEKIKPLTSLLEIDSPATCYLVCIGDRVSEEGHQDISFIEKALESLKSARGAIILRSTVLPKYLSRLPFHFYLPEFLHEINAVEECLNPFIFVLGTRGQAAWPSFLKEWKQRAIKTFKGSPEEASHLKYLSNIWNSLRVAFVNEFGDSLALPATKEDREKIERLINFFFENKSYLRYGKSFGGHCLPKDTRAFMAYKEETGSRPLLRAIYEANKQHEQIEAKYILPQWFSAWDYGAYGRGFGRFSRRLWYNFNSLKPIRKIRRGLHPILKWLERLVVKKNLPQLKLRWEKLAKKNPYYHANPDTPSGRKVDEFELRQRGENDFKKYILSDPLLCRSLNNFKDKKILEIGSGVGRMTEHFCKNFNQVYGIDISPSMLDIAKKRLADYKNVRLVETSGDNFPLDKEKFDLIFSYMVFKYAPTSEVIKSCFKEIARTLNEEGLAKVQLRTGTAPYFWQWYSGIALDQETAQALSLNAGLRVLKIEAEDNKSLWLWLKK